MATQNLSEHVLLITLPAGRHASTELTAAASATKNHDVIVSLSLLEALPSATICGLMALDWLLCAAGRQLILCSAPPEIMDSFKRSGLQNLFRFAEDEFAALQSLDRSGCPNP